MKSTSFAIFWIIFFLFILFFLIGSVIKLHPLLKRFCFFIIIFLMDLRGGQFGHKNSRYNAPCDMWQQKKRSVLSCPVYIHIDENAVSHLGSLRGCPSTNELTVLWGHF